MKTSIGSKVQQWADELQKVVDNNSYKAYVPYPDAFLSEQEEETN
jgi:hypothetical protein